jgi:hypothetical protein
VHVFSSGIYGLFLYKRDKGDYAPSSRPALGNYQWLHQLPRAEPSQREVFRQQEAGTFVRRALQLAYGKEVAGLSWEMTEFNSRQSPQKLFLP